MGRTLPWKKGGSTLDVTKSSSIPRSTTGNASPSSRASPSSSLAATPTRSASRPGRAAPTSHPRARQPSPGRTGTSARSSSPPPPPEPIPESLMIEGFENDDQWRMVEDEFYAVAGHFTAHLHAIQYRRLREEARTQNASTIRTISRPVTAPPTSHVKRRQAALSLATSQRQGVRTAISRSNVEDTEDEDDEIPWKGTHLAGLMSSPRKKAQPLASTSAAFGVSRAAASSSQGSRLGSPSTSRMAFARHHGDFAFTGTTTDNHAAGHTARLESSLSRTTSKRAQPLAGSSDDDGDLERYSSRQHPSRRSFSRTQLGTSRTTETSQSGRSRSQPSPAGVAPASRELPRAKPPKVSRSSSAAVAPVSNERDSDSGSETCFQRRMRERRSQHKSSRHKSSTPDEPSGKDESQNVALAVPPF